MLIATKVELARKRRIAAGIRDYYDSITEENRSENRQWGEFVLAQLSMRWVAKLDGTDPNPED